MQQIDYIVDMSEDNFRELLQATAEIPSIFYFTSLASPELNAYTTELEQIVIQQQGVIRLVKVDCEQYPHLAAQFRIQAIPTIYLFKDGAPIDAIQGIIPTEQLMQKLVAVLPRIEDLKYREALAYLEHEDYDNALLLLKEAYVLTDYKNSEIGLLYAETCIVMKKIELAQEILAKIPIQDRDSRWDGLQAQIELLLKAADTPEIAELQQAYAKNPDNIQIGMDLAVQLHQVQRNEEALTLLFNILSNNLHAADGKVKQEFLSIIAALGNSDPISNKYRKQLYTLMY